MMITQMLNVCNHDEHDTPETLKYAHQSEVLSQQKISVTCFPSIEIKSRFFMNPFS